MTKGTLSQWVTAATNMAVLIGVLLIIVELRQNAELARIEMIQGRINTNQQLESEFFEPHVTRIWVKSFMDPTSMTLEEIRTMDAYMVVSMNQVMREHALEQSWSFGSGSNSETDGGKLLVSLRKSICQGVVGAVRAVRFITGNRRAGSPNCGFCGRRLLIREIHQLSELIGRQQRSVAKTGKRRPVRIKRR